MLGIDRGGAGKDKRCGAGQKDFLHANLHWKGCLSMSALDGAIKLHLGQRPSVTKI
jgi:hypothetical protein